MLYIMSELLEKLPTNALDTDLKRGRLFWEIYFGIKIYLLSIWSKSKIFFFTFEILKSYFDIILRKYGWNVKIENNVFTDECQWQNCFDP
jgi:hypothetical protein